MRITLMYHGERFNAYSHLAGSMLAVAAFSADDSQGKRSLPTCLGTHLRHLPDPALSWLHALPQHSPAQNQSDFAKVDHCMIYLLIAGSYTPFTLIPLKGGWGWSLFGVSWSLALFGIIQELTIGRKSKNGCSP